jgi:class 3 adenylate cyclase
MATLKVKHLSDPDLVRDLPAASVKLYELGAVTMGRRVMQPGWRWSTHVKPIIGTASCEVHHIGIVLSGSLLTRMDDGSEFVLGPDDAYDIPPGHDGWVIGDEPWVTLDFAGVRDFGRQSEDERVLVSILFTDIVGSTQRAGSMGDLAWKQLLSSHDQEARNVLAEHRARLVQGTGDGYLALFDSAGRAVACAKSLGLVARGLGLEIRAGIHTGEVQLLENEVRGIAVHRAARTMAVADGNEVLVSATTRDLLAASREMAFESRGVHDLKGIEGEHELWAVTS